MGKFYVKPLVNTEFNNPPKLEWHKLYYNYEHCGDVLASFELVYKSNRTVNKIFYNLEKF